MSERVQAGTCDHCGEPIYVGDIIYSIARPGPRHAHCNDELRKANDDQIKASVSRIKGLLGKLRGEL